MKGEAQMAPERAEWKMQRDRDCDSIVRSTAGLRPIPETEMPTRAGQVGIFEQLARICARMVAW